MKTKTKIPKLTEAVFLPTGKNGTMESHTRFTPEGQEFVKKAGSLGVEILLGSHFRHDGNLSCRGGGLVDGLLALGYTRVGGAK